MPEPTLAGSALVVYAWPMVPVMAILVIAQTAFLPVRGVLPDKLLCGEYIASDGFAWSRLTLRLDHTFKQESGGDVGPIHKVGGLWKFERDVLVLGDRFQGPESKLVPVSWGRAVTLVEEDKIGKFLAAPPASPTDLHSPELVKVEYRSDASYIDIQLVSSIKRPAKVRQVTINMADLREYETSERAQGRFAPIERSRAPHV